MTNKLRSDMVLDDKLTATHILPHDCTDGAVVLEASEYDSDDILYKDLFDIAKILLNNQYDVFITKHPEGITLQYNHELNNIEHRWLTVYECDVIDSDRFAMIKDKITDID